MRACVRPARLVGSSAHKSPDPTFPPPDPMENCKNNFPTVRFLRRPILMFNTLRAVAQVWGEGGDGGM